MYKSGAGANLISAFKVSSTSDHERWFAKIIAGWLGELACYQKELFKLPFLILKVRYLAVS